MSRTHIPRRSFIKATGSTLLLSAAGCSNVNSQASHPNILWITCEDISPHLGCYGETYAHTPELDLLASQGVRYTNAHATAPVCTPTRSTIITGVYASSMGTQHLRGLQPLSPKIKCFTEYLRNAGYYCSNNSKEDYNFYTPLTAWDESSDTAHWRKRKPGQPFFSVFNLMMTHQSQTRYDRDKLNAINETLAPEERHDPARAPIPPYYPDTPLVRDNLAALHTQITLMDKKVGSILQELQEDGLDKDTIVFFYSDHGDGLPRGKRWLHNTGSQVPFIVRFPEKYKNMAPGNPGSTVDELISFIDLAPTVLNLAGLRIPDYMQGKPVLGRNRAREHDVVFGIRDRIDESLEYSRSIRSQKYQYIRNFFPHRPRMQRSFYSELTPIRQELRRLYAQGKLQGNEAWLMQPTKPAEELYDLEKDPWELDNLAERPEYQSTTLKMREQLYAWIIRTRDTALLPEADFIARCKGLSPYDVLSDSTKFPAERLLKTADMVGRGPAKLDDLIKALSDPDSGVRYWGAVGLTALGTDAALAKAKLMDLLKDPSPCTRFAAAEALCILGVKDRSIFVLSSGILDPDPRIVLHAAQHLFALGQDARPAMQAMETTVKRLAGAQDHGWYARETLSYLISTIKS